MRHEIVLTLIILLLLLIDVFVDDKKKLNPIAIIAFAVYTLLGFLPLESGSLFGGMFVNSPLINVLKNAMNIGVLMITLSAVSWVNAKMLPLKKVGEFYILLFSSYLGMLFLVSSGHFLMLYLGMELATLPVAALAAYDIFSRKSSEAGIKLILNAALSSGILLFGASIIYMTTGSLYFSSIANNVSNSYLMILGLIMLFAGFGFKISLVPFHFWTADVYEGAPTPVSNYLSVISKGGAIFILMILAFVVFNQLNYLWLPLFYGISIVTMFLGNFFALRQKNLQRFMAFSSVAQAGFILMGMLSFDQMAVTSVVYFIAIYIVSNIGAFGVIQAVGIASGKWEMDDYNGFYRTNPKMALVLMLALFSLAGIPPLAGFFGKFFLYTSAASQGYYWIVFLGILNATIALYYYLLVIRSAFLRTSENPIPYFKSDWYMRISMILVAIALIMLGLYSPFYSYINSLSIL
jgi:NADH-quinone oxidoreductase subunit N